MCKAYQDFYNQTVYKNRIIGLICSINLLKHSLFLKFNTFINIFTTFPFNSSYPTLMHLLEKCNTTTTQFLQQFSSAKQFTAYLAIPTRKFGFSFIELSYLPQVKIFKLLNINERKFKQNKKEMKKIKVNTKLCKEFSILLKFSRMGY